MVNRYLIPPTAFLLGSTLIASFYIGILTWAQGWEYASSQFIRDRWYVLPIIVGFGIQAALYAILRFRLCIPFTSSGHTGALIGTSGGTSATAMVACCLHHVTDVLPILGLSAAMCQCQPRRREVDFSLEPAVCFNGSRRCDC